MGWYPVTLKESDLPSVRTGTTETTCQLPDSAIWRGVHCPAGGDRPVTADIAPAGWPVLTEGQLPPPTYNDTGRQAPHWQPPAHPAAPNRSWAVLRPRLVNIHTYMCTYVTWVYVIFVYIHVYVYVYVCMCVCV